MFHKEIKNLVLFTLLYFIQGVPLGLWASTFALILVEKGATFTQLAILSFAIYPFSFKIVTAPILDTYYLQSIGKRRSYIIPIQFIMSGIYFMMYYWNASNLVVAEHINILALLGFTMILLAAHQDIAVDGWVLTAFSQDHVHLGAPCQSIGQTLGIIFSTTVFLTLNSASFCNDYIYTIPQDNGILTLELFCLLNCILLLIATVYVILFTDEHAEDKEHEGIVTVLHNIRLILMNRNVQKLLLYLLVFRIGFQPILVTTVQQLLANGIHKETISYIQTLLIPLNFLIPVVVGKYVKQGEEMSLIRKFFILRFVDCLVQYLLISNITMLKGWNTLIFDAALITIFSVTAFISNSMFICHGCLFNRISDPKIGGTYLTLINSIHNMGNSVTESISLVMINQFSYDFVAISSLIGGGFLYRLGSKHIVELQHCTALDWSITNSRKDKL